MRSPLASVMPFQIRAHDWLARFTHTGMDDFANNKRVIAGLINLPNLTFDIGESIPENCCAAGGFFHVAHFSKLVPNSEERFLQCPNSPPFLLIEQVQRESPTALYQIIGSGRLAYRDDEQGPIKRALSNPARRYRVHFTITTAANTQDIKAVRNLP